jgi:DNA adenine methylase
VSTSITNVASVPQRSPFRYPGGKTWLVPLVRRWLSSRPRRADRFVEPFAGGGIIGLTVAFEGLADSVQLAELDEDVAAVWETILDARGGASRLAERLRSFDLTPDSARAVLAGEPRTHLDRAFATILRNRVQHGGIMAPGASLMNAGENGRGIGSRWYPETLAKRVEAIAALRERIAFERADAFACIERHADDPHAALFVDPPYTVAGRRLYRHSEVDHPRLFELMARVRGEFIMTYDDAPDVRAWAADTGFDIAEAPMKSRQHRPKVELIIGRGVGWLGGAGGRAAPTRR